MTLAQTVVLVMAFLLVVCAVARVLTAVAARTTPADGARLYLGGRVDRLRIETVVAYDGELLVSLASEVPTELTAPSWRVVADASARIRLERWHREATALRAYRSADGPIMLADPTWGGNIACEPAVTVG